MRVALIGAVVPPTLLLSYQSLQTCSPKKLFHGIHSKPLLTCRVEPSCTGEFWGLTHHLAHFGIVGWLDKWMNGKGHQMKEMLKTLQCFIYISHHFPSQNSAKSPWSPSSPESHSEYLKHFWSMRKLRRPSKVYKVSAIWAAAPGIRGNSGQPAPLPTGWLNNAGNQLLLPTAQDKKKKNHCFSDYVAPFLPLNPSPSHCHLIFHQGTGCSCQHSSKKNGVGFGGTDEDIPEEEEASLRVLPRCGSLDSGCSSESEMQKLNSSLKPQLLPCRHYVVQDKPLSFSEHHHPSHLEQE